MAFIFEKGGASEYINRIKKLNANSPALWGKMNVAQMLAHCSPAFENNAPMPNLFTRFIIRFLVKSTVAGKKPYKKNMRTSKSFMITNKRDFEKEKNRLIGHLEKLETLGTAHFKNRKHPVFGKLSLEEWHNVFAKHLDHHLRQFGV